MGKSALDAMTEHAIAELLSGSDARRRALVRDMVQRWPGESALKLIFALTSAAAEIEDMFGSDGESHRAHALGYKLSALLAADVYALEAMGPTPVRARYLLHFWRRVDPYFLEL
ncbi:hypothetical protein DDZ14_09525 [Maritimibacter sp. 55A14]|uniref:hypothetical protein n=1 Tax=Maritimibacter sp. 55A14 TaxID=2174844 RepID=UPI000D614A0C|nr:hypothetical protein [Maritimibacter sp. 55A14]PWE32622.1 hypothetical protein DDZ14_09525 [Maritimibacter sp. 55A14]